MAQNIDEIIRTKRKGVNGFRRVRDEALRMLPAYSKTASPLKSL